MVGHRDSQFVKGGPDSTPRGLSATHTGMALDSPTMPPPAGPGGTILQRHDHLIGLPILAHPCARRLDEWKGSLWFP